MSLEELKADYKANTAAITALNPALTTTSELVHLIKNTIWPFVENVIAEQEELQNDIADLVDGIDDILHEETAGVIAAPIVAARALLAKYNATLPTGHEDIKLIKAWERMAAEAESAIAEIVVADESDEDEDEDDTDGEDAENEEE